MMPLVTAEVILTQGLRLAAVLMLAAVVTLGFAVVYRWYVREELPQGVGILLGAAAIAVVLNTTAALGQSIGGTTELIDPEAAAFTLLALALGVVASESGRIVGDRVGEHLLSGRRLRAIDRDIVSLVRRSGRTVRVTVPEEVHDIDGYDPVRADLKDDIAGETFAFSGRLTHQELHDAFVSRLQADLGIGKVDVEFDEAGEVVYLAVGRGEAGIGHTLPPGQVATAIRADPANSASPGDQVRVWRTDPEIERVVTGELRGVAGDVVTLAIDAEQADRLAAESGYRLVTLSRSVQPDREFATVLRRATERVVDATIAAGSGLAGTTVASTAVEVLAVVDADGRVVAPPPPEHALAVGDRVIAMGRPDALRSFDAAAQGTSP